MIQRLHLKIVSRFREVFGHKGDVKLYFSPGRVTIIGEHIDYSGGDTITAATDRGTYIVARKRADSKINIYAHSFKAKKTFTLDAIAKEKEDEWSIYFKGVSSAILESGYKMNGMDMFIYTDLPFHTSLASSSSLSSCFTYAALDINGKNNVSPIDMAVLSHKGETTFASQKTTLSDHATMFLAKQNTLFQFKMSDMSYEYLDFNIDDYSLAVVNSNKKRMSSDSEYNSRKRECENALKKLKEKRPNLKCLCDLKTKDLTFIKNNLQNKELRRTIYASNEEERVMQAIKAIKKGSIKDLAALILKTHEGLSTLYEVSTAELDILVEEAMKINGVFGARMIGTGFGGGVLMFIKKTDVENVVETLYTHYKERTKRDADVYILKPSDGARILQIE